MDAGQLFRDNLALIDRAIERVCRRAGLQGADADDFASEAKLALIENDYEILRRFRGDSSLATYVTVLVQNLLFDARAQTRGRWRPSAAAKRLGDTAVLLERLVRRDGRALEEVLPIVGLTREQATAMLAQLPEHAPRPRAIELDEIALPSAQHADERVLSSEAERLSAATSRVIRETLATLPLEDRTLVRMRFASNLSIADISRMLRLPQRPLYRRLEAILGMLRRELEKAGLDASTIADLIGATEMSFFEVTS